MVAPALDPVEPYEHVAQPCLQGDPEVLAERRGRCCRVCVMEHQGAGTHAALLPGPQDNLVAIQRGDQ